MTAAGRRRSSRRRSGSPSSTTTARSGARSRCRSSSTSSSAGSSRWRRPIPALRERQPWKAAYERDYGWFGEADGRALRGRRHERADARWAGILAAYEGISVEDFEAQSDAFLRTAQHPTLGRGYLRLRVRADGRAARLPGGERVLELHRLGRRPRLHAADQPGGVRHPARAGDRQRIDARLHERRAWRHDHAQGRGRLSRRRPAEADPDLEPHRPPAAARRRQLERRHPDARLHASIRTSRPSACSSSTTTPSASSTTRPAPSRRSSRPAATAGPSSASRTTGPRCSDPEHGGCAGGGHRLAAVTRRSAAAAGRWPPSRGSRR